MDGADLVVSCLGLDGASAREPLGAMRRRFARLPVLVEATREEAAAWPALVPEEERLEPGSHPLELVARVRRALGAEPLRLA